MADNFILVIDGLKELNSIDDLPKDIVNSARIAVNEATVRGRTMMALDVLKQVNLPSDYVAPRNKRLYVSEKATNSTLEGVITARSRPTSLARFAKENTPGRPSGGIRVEVQRGVTRTLPGAFLIRLRSGSTLTDTKNNMGLAVRTRDGRPPPGYKPARLGDNLWLLYGPSVQQVVFSETNQGGSATDLAPDIIEIMSNEFFRQMDLK